MKVTDIAIHTTGISGRYRTVGEVAVKVSKASVFSKSPTIEDANFKLQEEASKLGANAVVNVQYRRGMSLTSYEVLNATGTAVLAESDDVVCPFCAETIKRAARKCKHCGSDLAGQRTTPADPASNDAALDALISRFAKKKQN
jgi:ribosomal protein L37AE/L43A